MSPEEATLRTMREIESLSGTYGAQMVNLVRRAEERMMRELAQANLDPSRYTDAVRLEQYNRLKDSFNEILYGKKGTTGTHGQMFNAARQIYPASFKSAYRLARDELKTQVKVKAFPMVKPEIVAFTVLYEPQLSGLMDRFHRNLYDEVIRKLQEGVIMAKNPEVIARDLRSDLPRGRFHKAITRARLIARTEVPRALNVGKVTIYKGVGVTYVKVVGGTSICEQCAEYHDQVYAITDAPVLPVHSRCTHTYIPWDRDGVGIGFREAA